MSQATLLSRMTKRQKLRLEKVKEEHMFREAALGLAKQLVDDVGLWGRHLERYGDARLSAASWFLMFNLEEHPAAPPLQDYGIGSYWTGHDPEIDRFVRARAKWALSILEEDVKDAEIVLRNLEDRNRGW